MQLMNPVQASSAARFSREEQPLPDGPAGSFQKPARAPGQPACPLGRGRALPVEGLQVEGRAVTPGPKVPACAECAGTCGHVQT